MIFKEFREYQQNTEEADYDIKSSLKEKEKNICNKTNKY